MLSTQITKSTVVWLMGSVLFELHLGPKPEDQMEWRDQRLTLLTAEEFLPGRYVSTHFTDHGNSFLDLKKRKAIRSCLVFHDTILSFNMNLSISTTILIEWKTKSHECLPLRWWRNTIVVGVENIMIIIQLSEVKNKIIVNVCKH